jgi:hypothetical protein
MAPMKTIAALALTVGAASAFAPATFSKVATPRYEHKFALIVVQIGCFICGMSFLEAS